MEFCESHTLLFVRHLQRTLLAATYVTVNGDPRMENVKTVANGLLMSRRVVSVNVG